MVVCGCLICNGIAENNEVVAVEDFIDVGNILGKPWVALSAMKIKFKISKLILVDPMSMFG